MSNYKWIKDKLPDNLIIKQVYGIIFSSTGQVLLLVEGNKYKLMGGKPENGESMEKTLKRELLEELNIEIENIYYLGYLLVDEENGVKPYAQVRMIAQIKNIGYNRPDIDSGKSYKRFLSSPTNVKKNGSFPS